MAHILIVDDDPEIVNLLAARLRERGHSIDETDSVSGAMLHATNTHPNAVILDFCLPKVDGAGFIEILRADPLTRVTPVIVISAADRNWVASQLPQDPLVRLVEKPLDLEKLDQVLDELLAAAPKKNP